MHDWLASGKVYVPKSCPPTSTCRPTSHNPSYPPYQQATSPALRPSVCTTHPRRPPDPSHSGSEVYVGCTTGELLRYALQAESDPTKVSLLHRRLHRVTLPCARSQTPTLCSHVRAFRMQSPSMNSCSSLICPVC